jgi:hypothetical protein
METNRSRAFGACVYIVLLGSSVSPACANDFSAFTPVPGNDETGKDGAAIAEAGGNTADGAAGSDGATRDAAGGDAAAGASADASDDAAAPTCTLPNGATQCCGTVACTNRGGNCASVCAKCEAQCTNAGRKICCANRDGTVSCQSNPGAC